MKKRITLLCLLCLCYIIGTAAPKKNRFSIQTGINISHWLSQSDVRGEKRAAYFTEEDVRFLAETGFDHLRIPIDEEQMFTPEGEKEEEAFRLLHNALSWCKKYRLKAVVDLHILRSHHFNAQEKPLFTDRKEQLRFYDLWRQLSSELKRYSNNFLAYELMNEPVADDHEAWNRLVDECISTIRKLEPRRTLVIGSNRWQGYETVRHLRLPENDPNIIISFHYYNPFILTHYRASWTDMKEYTGTVHYPGKLIADNDLQQLPDNLKQRFAYWNREIYNKEVIESHFKQVLEVAKQHNLPVYCGEFGCIGQTPQADKERWYADVVALFNQYGIARANWDYKGGFSVPAKEQEQTNVTKILTMQPPLQTPVQETYPIPASEVYIRDPFITVDKKNSCYYIITSCWKDGRGGMVAYKSKDLQNWRLEKKVFQAAPDYLGTDDFWAPDTYEYNNSYYTFITVSNKTKGILRGTTILKSDSLAGTYTPILSSEKLNVTPDTMQCLDGSLFIDDDETPWMIFAVEWCGPNVKDKVGEVWAQKLKKDLTGSIGEAHRLFKASDAPWPLHIEGGGMITDAPFIWKDKKSGNLILTWSSFSPKYSIGQAISTNGNVLGPWKHEDEPIFSSDEGHQMIFRDLKGNLKMAFHSPNSRNGERRETLVIKDIKIANGKIEPIENRQKSKKKYFTKPVKTSDGKSLTVADPFVYRHNNTYYLTGTTGGNGFDYYVSSDMTTWEYKGPLYRKSPNHPGTSLFWAPEVKRYNGRYYLSYSCYLPEHKSMLSCLAVSNRPEGPYTDLHIPWFDFGYSAIDSHLFIDDNDTPFLYFSKNYALNGQCAVGEIYAVEMKQDLSEPIGKPVFISSASQDWEKVCWDINRCNEGPEVFKHGDTYYMTYSANDTGGAYYGIGVSYAKHPLGPWIKDENNPIITTDLSEGVSSPGHNSLVETSDGTIYIIYHRHADPYCKKPNWDRVVCIDRVRITKDGRLKFINLSEK